MRRRDPFADVEPAEYALPKGVPPLQEDPVRARRAFLAVVAGCLAIGGSGGWFAHSSWGGRGAAPRDEDLEWARVIALGSIDQLVEAAGPFLGVVDQRSPDPVLWNGVERLARASLVSETKDRQSLRRLLVRTLQTAQAPAELRNLIPALERESDSEPIRRK